MTLSNAIIDAVEKAIEKYNKENETDYEVRTDKYCDSGYYVIDNNTEETVFIFGEANNENE